jgi:hypothetical protein
MVEDGALETFDDASFNHDTFVRSAMIRIVNENETVRVKREFSSSPSPSI